MTAMLAEFIPLGNVAVLTGGTKLLWDGPNMTFPSQRTGGLTMAPPGVSRTVVAYAALTRAAVSSKACLFIKPVFVYSPHHFTLRAPRPMP